MSFITYEKKVAISSDKGYSEYERRILEYLNQRKEVSNADAREIIGLSGSEKSIEKNGRERRSIRVWKKQKQAIKRKAVILYGSAHCGR